MKILLYLVIFLVLFFVYVRFLEFTGIFYPSKKIGSSPRDLGLDFEDISFKTSDDLTLNAWLVKAPEAKATLLFFHGNAGNISDRLPKIELFHKMGLNVFIVDYRGYGKSQGHPSEKGIYLDAQASFDYLSHRKDLDKEKIICYGASLGSVAAIDLASQRKVACLISDSGFTSAADMAKRIAPFVPTFMLSVQMDNVRKVAQIKVPKLFIHSADDEIVPFRLGEKLFQAACEPKRFLKASGSHNEGFMTDLVDFENGIKAFLSSLNLI